MQTNLGPAHQPNRPIGCHNLAFVRYLSGYQKDISLLRFNSALIDNRSTGTSRKVQVTARHKFFGIHIVRARHKTCRID